MCVCVCVCVCFFLIAKVFRQLRIECFFFLNFIIWKIHFTINFENQSETKKEKGKRKKVTLKISFLKRIFQTRTVNLELG